MHTQQYLILWLHEKFLNISNNAYLKIQNKIIFHPYCNLFSLRVNINCAILYMLLELSLVVLNFLVLLLCSQKVNESGLKKKRSIMADFTFNEFLFFIVVSLLFSEL